MLREPLGGQEVGEVGEVEAEEQQGEEEAKKEVGRRTLTGTAVCRRLVW